MKCIKCGNEIEANIEYCVNCGAKKVNVLGKSNKLYMFAGLLMAGSLMVMGTGMFKIMQLSEGNFYDCFTDSKCMLVQWTIALIMIAFANRFIFLGRMENPVDKVRSRKKAVFGHVGIAVLFIVMLFHEIVYIRKAGAAGGLNGMQIEIAAAIVMTIMAIYFLKLAKNMHNNGQEVIKEQETVPSAVIESAADSVDSTMKLVLKIALVFITVIFLGMGILGSINDKAPDGFPLILKILSSLFILFPYVMFASVLTIAVVYYFLQKKISILYPEFSRMESLFNIPDYLKNRKKIKELYSKSHPRLGEYNRIIGTAGLVLLFSILLIIPYGMFVQHIGNSLGFWK